MRTDPTRQRRRRFFDATFGSAVRGLDLRWWDLRFVGQGADLEQAFKAAYMANSMGHVRFAVLMGFMLFAVFGVLDAIILPDHKEQIWLIRYGVLCPAAVLTFAATYTRWFPRYMQPLLAGLVMFSGFCITAMIVIAPEPASYSYYAGNILVIVFGYAFLRLRFAWATLAGWAVVGSYQVAALAMTETPLSVLVNNNFFFLSTNVIGMFASYYIEQYARRDFFLVNEISKERAAVEEARDELEARVEERTKQAMAAARSKSEFLANMSHEIRTPMNGVLGMLDLLRATPLDAHQQDQVDTAYQSAQGLLAILNDVLDLSKIEAGKMELHLEPECPGLIIEEVCAILGPQAEAKQLALVPLMHRGAYDWYQLDATRLRQILLNLLGNALKFTEQGHVSVSCRVNAGGLQIAVADTGIGISADKQAALFEAFTQADSSTTREFGGTGLGLTITRQLVELMQGEMRLESAPDQGACFTVSLPVTSAAPQVDLPRVAAKSVALDQPLSAIQTEALRLMFGHLECETVAAADADVVLSEAARITWPLRLARVATLLQPDQPVAAESVGQPTPLPPMSVLLVEDNPVNCRVAGAMLSKLGLRWQTADNGREALRLLDTSEFDVVLMDCQMPIMDGFEATREIRDRQQARGLNHLPVIALTANAMAGDRDACTAAGMDDYLAKPVNMDTLRQALLRWSPTVQRSTA